jgi:hypothetical protein
MTMHIKYIFEKNKNRFNCTFGPFSLGSYKVEESYTKLLTVLLHTW